LLLLSGLSVKAQSTTQAPPVSTVKFWSNLLFNEIASDVMFRCSVDGVEFSELIPANKGILSASSNYFRAKLSGAWSDLSSSSSTSSNNGGTVVDISVHPTILKATFRFIYTGTLDATLSEAMTIDPLCMACELMLEDLRQSCQEKLIKALSVQSSSIRDSLIAAHMHSCTTLIEGCFKFIERNPVVLTTPTFMTLAQEYPDLWNALSAFLPIPDPPPATPVIAIKEWWTVSTLCEG
jgi:hypothetical protein